MVPNLQLHAHHHLAVERMLRPARDPMARALERLQAAGMVRHDAIHGLAAVCWAHPVDALFGDAALSAQARQLRLNQALEELTVPECRYFMRRTPARLALMPHPQAR